MIISLGGPPYASLVGPAKKAVHISGIVHPVLAVELDHLAADGKYFRGTLNGLYHLADIVAVRLCIVI